MVKVLPKTEKKFRPTKYLIPFSLYSRSLTYRKLPEQHIKLSVLKLDGSSFSFHVARNATVAGVKLAIEEEFSLFPKDEREKLWSLVWSHFCLCYEGQKLIRDAACIKKYGIKDGDQLQFIQHLRIDVPPTSKKLTIDFKQCSLISVRHAKSNHRVTLDDQYAGFEYFDCAEESALQERRTGLTRSLKEMISCPSFQNSKRSALGIGRMSLNR